MWASQTECGTAYCIAGWAVHISHPDAMPDFDQMGDAFTCVLPNGAKIDIMDTARALLGLTENESRLLFSGFKSREGIQRHAEQIAARAGESL